MNNDMNMEAIQRYRDQISDISNQLSKKGYYTYMKDDPKTGKQVETKLGKFRAGRLRDRLWYEADKLEGYALADRHQRNIFFAILATIGRGFKLMFNWVYRRQVKFAISMGQQAEIEAASKAIANGPPAPGQEKSFEMDIPIQTKEKGKEADKDTGKEKGKEAGKDISPFSSDEQKKDAAAAKDGIAADQKVDISDDKAENKKDYPDKQDPKKKQDREVIFNQIINKLMKDASMSKQEAYCEDLSRFPYDIRFIEPKLLTKEMFEKSMTACMARDRKDGMVNSPEDEKKRFNANEKRLVMNNPAGIQFIDKNKAKKVVPSWILKNPMIAEFYEIDNKMLERCVEYAKNDEKKTPGAINTIMEKFDNCKGENVEKIREAIEKEFGIDLKTNTRDQQNIPVQENITQEPDPFSNDMPSDSNTIPSKEEDVLDLINMSDDTPDPQDVSNISTSDVLDKTPEMPNKNEAVERPEEIEAVEEPLDESEQRDQLMEAVSGIMNDPDNQFLGAMGQDECFEYACCEAVRQNATLIEGLSQDEITMTISAAAIANCTPENVDRIFEKAVGENEVAWELISRITDELEASHTHKNEKGIVSVDYREAAEDFREKMRSEIFNLEFVADAVEQECANRELNGKDRSEDDLEP